MDKRYINANIIIKYYYYISDPDQKGPKHFKLRRLLLPLGTLHYYLAPMETLKQLLLPPAKPYYSNSRNFRGNVIFAIFAVCSPTAKIKYREYAIFRVSQC